MGSIVSILMKRDGLTQEEANDQVDECRQEFNKRLSKGEMPFDICEEYFGLEQDYLEEFM